MVVTRRNDYSANPSTSARSTKKRRTLLRDVKIEIGYLNDFARLVGPGVIPDHTTVVGSSVQADIVGPSMQAGHIQAGHINPAVVGPSVQAGQINPAVAGPSVQAGQINPTVAGPSVQPVPESFVRSTTPDVPPGFEPKQQCQPADNLIKLLKQSETLDKKVDAIDRKMETVLPLLEAGIELIKSLCPLIEGVFLMVKQVKKE